MLFNLYVSSLILILILIFTLLCKQFNPKAGDSGENTEGRGGGGGGGVGAAIGGVVAALLVIAVVAVLVIIFIWWRRR